MERESFEDEEVAAALNAGFVAVKVDREERPDVDQIYMSVCQALTGAGGWPLTVIMTPDRKPFFAGTYFPKNSKWGRPGLVDILDAAAGQWARNRAELTETSEKIMRAIQPQVTEAGELSPDMLDAAYHQLEQVFDVRYGGFGQAPKFPTPHNLMFLLRYWRRTGNAKALAMVAATLEAMSRGGIYDQLGFGFARYSTDERWLVPHFEKMLYDNALLCFAYLEGYQCCGKPEFARVAEEVIQYVLRDMTSAEGGFYSAEDADSEGAEGRFYAWTQPEIIAALGEEDGELFADFYGVTATGNFEQGTSVLHQGGGSLDEFAAQRDLAPAVLAGKLSVGRERLYQLREGRVHPFKDDKILTAWNGLMIAALAKAAQVLGKADYSAAAERAVEFLFTRLLRTDGRLLARYRDGEAGYLAYLDDHAFLLWGLVELYEATFDPRHLERARQVACALRRLFLDERQGGFYFYGSDGEGLIARPKEIYDGAIPSGNSVAAWALLRLGRLMNDSELIALGEKTLKGFAGEVGRYPRAYTFFLTAVDFYLEPPRQIVVAGSGRAEDVQAMLRVIGAKFLPTTSVLVNDSDCQQEIGAVLPHIAGEQALDGRATAYVCENFACRAPEQGVEQLQKILA